MAFPPAQHHNNDSQYTIDALAPVKTVKPPKKWYQKRYKTPFGGVSFQSLFQKKYLKYWAALVICCIVVGLMTLYHHEIVTWLKPVSEKIKDLKFGWLIFVGVMFVISFPPLFGHEVVALICGLVYGLWIGFAVVSLGTLLGECGNYIAFRWMCVARGEKLERTNASYACMAHITRNGGFKMIFLIRLSAIPGHFSTAVFAAVKMNFWIFTIATILTLPKQMMVVYLGTIFDQEASSRSTASKIVEYAVLGLSFVVTIWIAWYIYREMGKVMPIVEQEMRQRQAENAASLGVTSIDELNSRPISATNKPWSGDDKEAAKLVSEAANPGYSSPYSRHSVPYTQANYSTSDQYLGRQDAPYPAQSSETLHNYGYAISGPEEQSQYRYDDSPSRARSQYPRRQRSQPSEDSIDGYAIPYQPTQGHRTPAPGIVVHSPPYY